MSASHKHSINLLTLIIAAIIFIQMNFLLIQIVGLKEKQNATVEVKLSKWKEEKQQTQQVVEDEAVWKIRIPKINLSAEIRDGTTSEIINSYVGHFKETAYETGNIGLAAHNEGYKENYFENLEQLKIDDKIEYQKGNFKKEYQVIQNTIIEESDWTYLRKTEDNRITLITCVANNPDKRRCVQAIEVK